MGLPKGKTNNPRGRPKGTKNKSTNEIKGLIQDFISRNLDDLQTQYSQLEPKDKLIFFERILKYVLPQQRDVNQTINFKELSDEEMDMLINKLTKPEKNENH
ncbi:MAG: hypothetical protein JG782_994 [Anaerophaga sp.]|nr:hypothetical protein [Anaerophaga sp.]MDN5290106.1 hypothetical protein [Anaerophaga sp.]